MERLLSAGILLVVALRCGALTPPEPCFDVSTVKSCQAAVQRPWVQLHFTRDGLDAKGVTLRTLLKEAYGLYDESRLTGGPAWLDADCFDVTAKLDSDDAAKVAELPLETRRTMLQQLLAERFGVKAHHEQKSFPVFDLIIAPGGPKLQKTAFENGFGGVSGASGQVRRVMPGGLTIKGEPMPSFARRLGPYAHRIVVDHTGLTGRYDITLDWLPDTLSATAPLNEFSNGAPPLPKALEQQLGLRLKPANEILDVVIVDRAERSAPN